MYNLQLYLELYVSIFRHLNITTLRLTNLLCIRAFLTIITSKTTHLPGGSDKCLLFLLWGDEWDFTDGVDLCLTRELGLNRTYQLLYQVILGLLLQLQQLASRLWQRHRAIAQKVEYCAEMLAASVDEDPPWHHVGKYKQMDQQTTNPNPDCNAIPNLNHSKSSESVQCTMLKACHACADMGQL